MQLLFRRSGDGHNRTITYNIMMYFYMQCIQVVCQSMDAAFHTVMSKVPTVPLPPTKRSTPLVSLLSSAAFSDSQPGSSAADLGHSPHERSEDLGHVTPLTGTVQSPLEAEGGFGEGMTVSGLLM